MKIVEVLSGSGYADTVAAIAEQHEAYACTHGAVAEDGTQSSRLLVADEKVQRILDALQNMLGAQPAARIVVIAVETVLPRPPESERRKEDAATAAREALYDTVEKNARLDINFAVLVVLSTVVAAIGLIENNVAVVIGAMVIAPLLGPNLALGLGTALGDIALMRKALVANAAGIGLAVGLSVVIGMVWPFPLTSSELLARTQPGFDSIGLALASGAAAALSLTTGLPSVLVGVMVAVALLPPAAALGLMLGHARPDLAFGAGLLLAVNVVCVNLASKLVFLVRGIRPRTWWEKEKAKRAMATYLVAWGVTLAILAVAIYFRRDHLTGL